jgi:uncharacterized membrane protein SirB2
MLYPSRGRDAEIKIGSQRKVLIKWSGIFLGHLFINKNQVMWRTESRALVIALIVLGGIWYVKQGNNRRADAIAVLMENGELIVTICIY